MITIRTKVFDHDKIYLHTNFHENWVVGDGVVSPEMTIFC